MKRRLLSTVVLSALLQISPCSLFAAETYTLDPSHTYVLWRISHFGFSTQAGKWYASGTLVLDKENPANSKVNTTIDLTNMSSGLPELDKHLKGKLFFDTAKYPKATFVSDKVVMTGDKTAEVHGMLTLHGVTKPVILNVTLNQAGVNPITEKNTAGFSASSKITRSDFGIKTLIPGLGDDVALDIQAESFQSKKPT